MSKKNSITALTRRNIFDYLSTERVALAGRLEETQFIVRVWPEAVKLPSFDTRYKDAPADIHQHRINNYDWDDDWVFGDSRFKPIGGSDELFLAFLSEMVHPVVRSDEDEVTTLVTEFNRQLRRGGARPVVPHHQPSVLGRLRSFCAQRPASGRRDPHRFPGGGRLVRPRCGGHPTRPPRDHQPGRRGRPRGRR